VPAESTHTWWASFRLTDTPETVYIEGDPDFMVDRFSETFFVEASVLAAPNTVHGIDVARTMWKTGHLPEDADINGLTLIGMMDAMRFDKDNTSGLVKRTAHLMGTVEVQDDFEDSFELALREEFLTGYRKEEEEGGKYRGTETSSESQYTQESSEIDNPVEMYTALLFNTVEAEKRDAAYLDRLVSELETALAAYRVNFV
jgi:hypothetical protein